MESLKYNLKNELIVYVDNFLDDFVEYLLDKFKYKNIAIIGLNNELLESKIREQRSFLSFVFCNKYDKEIVEHADVILVFNIEFIEENYLDLNINNKQILLCVDNENMLCKMCYFLDKHLKENKVRIIINKESKKSYSKLYCQYLMKYFINKFREFQNSVDKMFFLSSQNYYYENIYNNLVRYNNFSLDDYFDTLIEYGETNTNSQNIYCILDEVFLESQILLNLYKNFFVFALPTHIQKLEDYFFDEKKFWFVKEKCKKDLLNNIQCLEKLCEKVKDEMCKINVDFYYRLSLKFDNYKFNHNLVAFAEQCDNLFLKAIYQMGLLEF